MARLRPEKYKGITITFKEIKDVDGYRAVAGYVSGRWIGTTSTKAESLARAKKVVNRYQKKGY